MDARVRVETEKGRRGGQGGHAGGRGVRRRAGSKGRHLWRVSVRAESTPPLFIRKMVQYREYTISTARQSMHGSMVDDGMEWDGMGYSGI